jgi:Peptidase M50B-like
VVSLALLGGFTVAALLFGGVTSLRLIEGDKGAPGAGITRPSLDPLSTYVIGLIGFLTPPLLGLAGAYLVLVGRAWSLLWVVIVLLFVAYVKTRDWFTTVIVLLLGAGLGWVVVRGDPDLQAGVAVALVWLLLLGAISRLVRTRRSDSGNELHVRLRRVEEDII